MGMTRSQVEAILGAPDLVLSFDINRYPIDHSISHQWDPWNPPTRRHDEVWGYRGRPEHWFGPDYYYDFTFGFDGKVYATTSGRSWKTTPRSRFIHGIRSATGLMP
jgi:hypothetical protein